MSLSAQDCIVRHFALNSDDRQKANHAFMDYKQLILSRRRSKKSRSKKACGKAPSTQQERRCCRLFLSRVSC
ncbi:hypothetical protein FOXG_19163 [Fusarium oxysporum f. sp. lycopersici 4287]|uniref:Uncharacterized protein n=2 Tax=Fusarium oxysporum TaxID=5507 RepID=A0A0J9WLD3_FUSO4|nr:hypothetical protein FOXG_19163 [Fusarium oxysporum f. sp. lycopersici 4287]EXK33161.1 hypothetical protein FOMG_11924 [Fusarium oxysporum f. sp. melonis 26406]KNB03582.1 hypothetical protein FOXG_19163 [Fusarium oxysporum f. sp. lycopersici 4287]